MKILFLIATILCFKFISFSQVTRGNKTLPELREYQSEKQRIKTQKIKCETVKEINVFANNTQTDKVTSTTKYDSTGNQIEMEIWTLPNYYTRTTDIYDQKGNNIRTTFYNNSKEKITSINVFKYDSKNNKTEFEKLFPDGRINYKYFFEYDSLGNKISEKSVTYNYKKADGNSDSLVQIGTILTSNKLFKYDSIGNLIEQVSEHQSTPKSMLIFKYKGKLKTKTISFIKDTLKSTEIEFLYDKKGNLIQETSKDFILNPKGIIRYIYKYKYDNLNHKIEFTEYNNYEIIVQKITYKYLGNLILEENRFNSLGDPVFKYVYKYDKNGLLLEKTNFDIKNNPHKTIEQYKYEFYK